MFFFVFTTIAIVILILYYRSIPKSEISMHWGLAMILPGAFGNLLDRVIHPGKGVVDFIRLGISPEIYWPIFNLADVYVTIGIGILLYSFWKEEKSKKTKVDLLISGATQKIDITE
jgi:signal peptidase II